VPKGVKGFRLDLTGRPGLQALHVFDSRGNRRGSAYWHTKPHTALDVVVPKEEAGALWSLRRGLSTNLQVRLSGTPIPPYLATTPDRFFIPKTKPRLP